MHSRSDAAFTQYINIVVAFASIIANHHFLWHFIETESSLKSAHTSREQEDCGLTCLSSAVLIWFITGFLLIPVQFEIALENYTAKFVIFAILCLLS